MKCANCDKEFESKTRTRFCSDECLKAYYKKPEVKKKYKPKPRLKPELKFNSIKKFREQKPKSEKPKKTDKKCPVCGKLFSTGYKRIKIFCSPKCQRKHHRNIQKRHRRKGRLLNAKRLVTLKDGTKKWVRIKSYEELDHLEAKLTTPKQRY